MSKPLAKVIAFDAINVRGRSRRWQNKPTDPDFPMFAAFVICLLSFAIGFVVGFIAAHVPLSVVAP